MHGEKERHFHACAAMLNEDVCSVRTCILSYCSLVPLYLTSTVCNALIQGLGDISPGSHFNSVDLISSSARTETPHLSLSLGSRPEYILIKYGSGTRKQFPPRPPLFPDGC